MSANDVLQGPVLETRGLTKEFRGFTAVDDVNLQVQEGHIHALIGPNGAGKTTVFNLLTKFLPPTRGDILYRGHPITSKKSNEIAQLGLVRSFQISAGFWDFVQGFCVTFRAVLAQKYQYTPAVR